MAGIKITGKFITNDPADAYPLIGDDTLEGGLRVVDTLVDRDNITDLRRKWGMLVFVNEDNTLYQLIDQGNGDITDNTNWVVFIGSSGAITDIYQNTFIVTSPYQANETIDIISGNGSISGTSDIIRSGINTLGATQEEFENNNRMEIFLNGVKLEKTIDVKYEDSTHLSFQVPLDINDIFEIKRLGG